MEPKSRPILFTAEMVRAILDGRKTQTRRVIKPQPDRIKQKPYCLPDEHFVGNLNMGKCPYGQPGDRLWVREGFGFMTDSQYVYRADYSNLDELFNVDVKWKSPIHMPRWASRITLLVKSVRVERVQDISEGDAIAEGCWNEYSENIHWMAVEMFGSDPEDRSIAIAHFHILWDSINAKKGFGWTADPWVWVVEFEVTG